MNGRNLMPPARLADRRRRRATRRWLLIDGAYAGVLFVAGLSYWWCTAAPVSADGAAVATDIGRADARLAALRQQTATLDTDYRAAVDLSSRPDWAALLAALSRAVGDDVVLESLDCAEGGAAASANATGMTPAGPAGSRRLSVAGVGRSQQSVTEFVLRVEAMGFFDRVRLDSAAPQSVAGQAGVGFRVVCTMADWPGGAS